MSMIKKMLILKKNKLRPTSSIGYANHEKNQTSEYHCVYAVWDMCYENVTITIIYNTRKLKHTQTTQHRLSITSNIEMCKNNYGMPNERECRFYSATSSYQFE
jgi:hypothetical protein